MAAAHWYDDAACKGMDVELFYAEGPGATAQALRTCAACPVRRVCSEVAMAEREAFGVWGGTLETHRRRIFRREDRARRRAERAA